MKHIFFFLVIFISFSVKAQTNVNADCIDAIPLCNTPSFTFFATSGSGNVIDFNTSSSISNPTNNPFSPDNGCLKSGELKPQWLLLTVGNAGVLEFVFGAGNSPNPQNGCYDWIMWPYSPSTCANIFNNTLPPIRCNWNATCQNGTGIASGTNIAALGGNTGDFGDPLVVNACQQFMICISNYSGVNTLVSFQSIGTASLSCNPNCNPNYSMCAGSSATIVPVNFAALTNPTFVIQPGGQTNTTGIFVVSPSSTSSYSTFITGLNATNAVQTISATSIVTVMPQPTAVPTITQSTCTNSLTSLKVGLTYLPQAPSSYSLVWSPLPNGIASNSQTTVTNYIPGGIYNVTVTAAGGCTTSTSFTVNPTPELPVINLSPSTYNYTLTCANPGITLTALDASLSYTWSNGLIAPITGPSAEMTFTSSGTWTIIAVHPVSGCVTTKTVVIGTNTVVPSSSITPLFQNITCNLSSIITVSAIVSPTVNVSHQFMAPVGGTFVVNSTFANYIPYGIGIYTHCAVNDANGCSNCKTFTVTSNQGFPTFNVNSPQNFTLGCTTKSVATINIINGSGTPQGSPVSYTLIGPGTSTTIPTGTLSGQSVYTVNIPGSYTVITKDNTSFCETRVPISILSNTFSPNISVEVPRQILDCNFPKVKLIGLSETNNVSYNWSWPASPGNQPSDSITVRGDFSAPTKSIVAQYTLTITDQSSTCKSTSIVPIYQNLFLPNVAISNGGVGALNCKTPTITLTNQSTTGILGSTGFSTVQAVQALLWQGPTPQEDLQISTTYVAATSGVYTMTARDLNNGCIKTGTVFIQNNVLYPIISFTAPSVLDCSTGKAVITASMSAAPAGTSYTISPPLGAAVNTLISTVPTFTTTGLGPHRIIVLNPANGCGASAIQNVIPGTLTAAFVSDVESGYMPLTVTFSNTSATNSNTLQTQNGASSIKTTWNFANGTSSISVSGSLTTQTTFKAPGKYRIKMYAMSGSCKDSLSHLITVDLPSELEIPNIFTPNGDGKNDVFFLHAKGLTEVNFQVTDRWGREVYHVIGHEGNISWDGKDFSGKDCSDGVYFYTLKASGLDGKTFDTSGNISLIR
jgi:gliding motility-associated-like protein